MPDIFLSYNREDQARAQLFAEAFDAQGFTVWWDVGLRTGEAYDQVTEKALKTAKAVVVLWSKKSVDSRWVRAEATLADRNKTLLPCMIEPCERPIMFELTQTAELSHWRGEKSDRVWLGFLADVARLVGRERAPASAQSTAAPIHVSALATETPSPRDACLDDVGASRLEKTDEDIDLALPKPQEALRGSGDPVDLIKFLWHRARSRKVVQWGFGYLVIAFGAMQGVAVVAETQGWPAVVGRLVLALLATGFPVALIVAWFHGERGRQRVEAAEMLSIGVALFAGAVLVAIALRGPTHTEPAIAGKAGTVIAVLPFEVTGPDQTEVGKALPGRIVDALLNTGQVQTIAWNSSAQFAGARKPEAAKALAVSYVLDGAVRQESGTLEVTANLIDAKRSVAMWTQTWRRPLKDVRLVEEEIAERVADALNVRVGSHWARARGAIDDDVYNLYLRAREHSRLRGAENGSKAIAELEEVTRRAPDFSAGWSALAVNRFIYQNAADADPETASSGALAAARKALRVDPANGEALGVQARLAPTWGEAIDKMQRALDLQPYNSTLLNWSGIMLARTGFTVRATDAFERGAALDPLSTAVAHNYLFALVDTGRIDDAHKVFERLSFLRVQNANTERTASEALDLAWESGNFAEFVSLHRHAGSRAPRTAASIILGSVSEALANDRREAYGSLAADVRASKDLDEKYAVESLVLLGDLDGAFARAGTLATRAQAELPDTAFLFGRLTRPLRHDTRFMALSEQIGLLRYWQSSKRWPDFCADPQLPYRCAAAARGGRT